MDNLSLIIEALLFSSSRPLSEKEILSAFDLRSPPTSNEIKEALKSIEEKYSENSIEIFGKNYGKLNLKNTLELSWKL